MTSESTAPDLGLLQAYLDDELSAEDRTLVESRLEADPVWATELKELKDAATTLSRGLVAQDATPLSGGPPPWIGVLNRGAQAAPRRFPLGRAAAAAVLVVGAVASGLPGSPVREWFADRFTESVAVTEPATEAVTATAEVPDESAEVGVRVGTPAGSLLVSMDALPEGTELVVTLDGEEAGVFGPAGTRFRTQDGRVEVLNPSGTLRVELPAELTAATILVGDVVYLNRDGDLLETPGPVFERTEAEIRFTSES